MIKLPKQTLQNLYDSETIFNLFMNEERLSKLLIHYEIFNKIKKLNGSIVECGVFKGTSFARFSMFRKMFGKSKNKLIAFDVFIDNFQILNLKMKKQNIG